MSNLLLDMLVFIIKMCIGLAIALGSVILGIYLLKFAVKYKYNFELNVKGNLKLGNISMALLIGAIAIAVIMIAEVGFTRIFTIEGQGLDFAHQFILIELSILIAILISVFLVLLALICVDNLLKDLQLLMEVKDGNVAISIIFSIIILIIGIVGRAYTSGIIQILESYAGF